MKRNKKSMLFAATIISCTLFSSVFVYAGSALNGVVTGNHYTTPGVGAVKNTAWTSSSDNSIQIYAKACFSNNESASRTSSVTTGYAEVFASDAASSEAYAYGYHGYLYNGPRYFISN